MTGCSWVFAWIPTDAYMVLTRVLTGTYTDAVRCPGLSGTISSRDLVFCLQGHRVPVYSPSGRGSGVSKDAGDIHRALAS